MSTKARREIEERRARFYRERTEKAKRYAPRRRKGSSYSEWFMRRLAPFSLLIMTGFVVFGLLFLTGVFSSKVDTGKISYSQGDVPYTFEVPAGGIYEFKAIQRFVTSATPSYSELEIEVLDKDYSHLYSVYKDLWQESHPNGNGGKGIYRDETMEFELVLPKEGTYHIRGISNNNYYAPIYLTVNRSGFTHYFFLYGVIFFGALLVLLIVGREWWGTFLDMWYAVKEGKIRNWRKNRLFLFATGLLSFLIFIAVYSAITHAGYPTAGENTYLPSWTYSTGDIKYLG